MFVTIARMHPEKRSSLVWLFSAGVLITYATLGLFGVGIPGVEELVSWLSTAKSWQFYVGGFLAILIEGLYVVGNFFPGTTLVLLLAMLSGIGGSVWQFWLTIGAIFLGWCLAGLINILVAHFSLARLPAGDQPEFKVKDNLWLTWYPAFRANYEVAQIAAGGNLWQVLMSALRVRFLASLGAAGVAWLLIQLIDLEEIDNEEGFMSVLAVAVVMVVVGVYHWRQAKPTDPTPTDYGSEN